MLFALAKVPGECACFELLYEHEERFWVNQSIRQNVTSQALPPRSKVLTLEMKMVRNAGQNCLGDGGLLVLCCLFGFFFFK